MKFTFASIVILFWAPTLFAAEGTASPTEAVREACQTGTLLFSQGDCLAVRIYTNSPYTHVAVVVEEESGPIVYDSMNGVGVRKLPLETYVDRQIPDKVHLYQPRREFTDKETASLQKYLDSQLGRPYAVAHHVTGKRCEGLHCSEFVTDALIQIDWLKAKNPARVSPATLAEGVAMHDVYHSDMTVEIPFEAEPTPEPTTRCGKWWLQTKLCVGRGCGQMSRWFLCR